MKVIARTPLETIRSQEEQLKAKDAQLQGLGISLAEEKLAGIQKDAVIKGIGQQLTQIRIEIIGLRGDGA